MKTKTLLYRHWGHKAFIPENFMSITNDFYRNKPLGGLWASPITDSDITWEYWCRGADFMTDRLNEYFDFTLKDNAKVLVIKDLKDLDNLPRRPLKDTDDLQERLIKDMNADIDFSKLAEEYDAMLVYMHRSTDIPEDNQFLDGIYYKLYGWDVDTLLVFNPDIIEEIKEK